MLLVLAFLPVLGALSASLPMNLTNLGPYSKPAPENLRLDPLPNPFPIPGTDITLEWNQAHHIEQPLIEADTDNAFLKCKSGVDAHLRSIGDGPISSRLFPHYLITVYRTVVVELTNEVPGVILYSEVTDILRAIMWKMSAEGYRSCWVRVLRTDGGAMGERLGRVSVRNVEGGDAGVSSPVRKVDSARPA